MRNKFKATCSLCGNPVAVGEGDVVKVGDKWQTKHDRCDIQKKEQKLRLPSRKRYARGRSGFVGLDPW